MNLLKYYCATYALRFSIKFLTSFVEIWCSTNDSIIDEDTAKDRKSINLSWLHTLRIR